MAQPLMRTCVDCKEEKELTIGFHKRYKNKKGEQVYRRECKDCKTTTVVKQQKTSGYKHSNKCRFGASKRGATKGNRNYCYELTENDYKILTTDEVCFYCGEQDGDTFKFVGVDRVNNNIGYKIGNVLPCCKRCNMAKSDNSFKEYVLQCSRVAKKFKYLYYDD